MRKPVLGTILALALASAVFVVSSPASARVSFGISINENDVMFAYQDGYWDRGHQWHPWGDPDDWHWYREHHRDRYFDWRHDRDPDMGWHGSVGISFNEADVMFAYRDSYWDHSHQWHPWRNHDDWRLYRDHHHDQYFDWRHDRDPDMGWHDTH